MSLDAPPPAPVSTVLVTLVAPSASSRSMTPEYRNIPSDSMPKRDGGSQTVTV